MNVYRKLVGLTILILLAMPVMAAAAAPNTARISYTRADVTTHPSQGPVTPVTGGKAHLLSGDGGIAVALRTSMLPENHAHTLWVVVINNPELCQTSPCSPNDILARTDIVKANVVYGDGYLVRKSGKAFFSAYLPTGHVEGGWYTNPFTNPRGAEVHLVINDHGPAIPGMVDEMLTTYRAGCTDESLPAAFPPTAKADGTPGPNQCRLVQVAIFQQ